MTPGIYPDLSFADYLGSDAASASQLWTMYTRTAAHVVEAEDEATPEQDFGTAAHVAILEPNKFEAAVIRGPENRQGNKWKEALAEFPNSLVLPAGDHEKVERLRDAAMRDPTIKALALADGMAEASAFWIDQETGLLCRCRPDKYTSKLKLIADLKTTTNASEDAFWPIAKKMGYHVTDVFYTEGWEAAGGGPVEDYIFIAIERDPPFAHQIFQYERPERELGYMIVRRAMERYRHCKETGYWPGYSTKITKLRYPEWVHNKEANNGTPSYA